MPSSRRRENADLWHSKHMEGTEALSVRLLNTSGAERLIAQLTENQGPILSIEDSKKIMQRLTVMSGTNLEENENDLYGDGDQTIVGALGEEGEPVRQILRHLFAKGGDLMPYIVHRGFSKFAFSCGVGDVKAVEKALKATEEGSDERIHMLEKRETGMRFSPLLLTVALSKCKSLVSSETRIKESEMNHIGVIKVLLKYGARPDVKELTGKTVAHYGAGAWATPETLQMVDYCLEANKTCEYFRKQVVIRNLSTEKYNGLTGYLGGFLADTGRREVILDNDKKHLALLPEKIYALDQDRNELKISSPRNLLNEPDRLGSTSFHEVFMSQRIDVAEFLIEHNASVDIEEYGGKCSVRKYAYSLYPYGISTMNHLVRKYVTKMEKVENKNCYKCKTISEKMSKCGRCNKAIYCSKECQIEHWPLHKVDCKKKSQDENYSIQLSTPTGRAPFSNEQNDVNYRRPDGVSVDELFWIKIQSNSDDYPHLVYDQTRSCCFYIYPNTSGHLEVYERVSKESVFNGKKVYCKAAFDAGGNCRIYPNISSTTKRW